jgi:hypothetical protein
MDSFLALPLNASSTCRYLSGTNALAYHDAKSGTGKEEKIYDTDYKFSWAVLINTWTLSFFMVGNVTTFSSPFKPLIIGF